VRVVSETDRLRDFLQQHKLHRLIMESNRGCTACRCGMVVSNIAHAMARADGRNANSESKRIVFSKEWQTRTCNRHNQNGNKGPL
jgi:hypothetical protein